jgi:hypothetical protein
MPLRPGPLVSRYARADSPLISIDHETKPRVRASFTTDRTAASRRFTVAEESPVAIISDRYLRTTPFASPAGRERRKRTAAREEGCPVEAAKAVRSPTYATRVRSDLREKKSDSRADTLSFGKVGD